MTVQHAARGKSSWVSCCTWGYRLLNRTDRKLLVFTWRRLIHLLQGLILVFQVDNLDAEPLTLEYGFKGFDQCLLLKLSVHFEQSERQKPTLYLQNLLNGEKQEILSGLSLMFRQKQNVIVCLRSKTAHSDRIKPKFRTGSCFHLFQMQTIPCTGQCSVLTA